MSLDQLANLGEFVGGIAVLLTLIYLAKQIRQSNALVRAEAYQDASRRSSDLLFALTEPGNLGIGAWSHNGYAALPEAERFRASLRFLAFVNYYETLFYARERGEVDDELWESRVSRMRWTFADVHPEVWALRRDGLGQRFREFVESELLEETHS